jgi:hypothetical protein
VLVYQNSSEITYINDIIETCTSEFLLWKSVSLVTNCSAIVLACHDKKN